MRQQYYIVITSSYVVSGQLSLGPFSVNWLSRIYSIPLIHRARHDDYKRWYHRNISPKSRYRNASSKNSSLLDLFLLVARLRRRVVAVEPEHWTIVTRRLSPYYVVVVYQWQPFWTSWPLACRSSRRGSRPSGPTENEQQCYQRTPAGVRREDWHVAVLKQRYYL
jgi:hypothetical protein